MGFFNITYTKFNILLPIHSIATVLGNIEFNITEYYLSNLQILDHLSPQDGGAGALVVLAESPGRSQQGGWVNRFLFTESNSKSRTQGRI